MVCMEVFPCSDSNAFLSPVGQDCYTRIWSLQDTHLLRTIPSPHPSSKDSIPSVVFSSKLGGSRGVPGLLMAVRQDLYHFSYSWGNPYCPQTKVTDHPAHLSDSAWRWHRWPFIITIVLAKVVQLVHLLSCWNFEPRRFSNFLLHLLYVPHTILNKNGTVVINCLGRVQTSEFSCELWNKGNYWCVWFVATSTSWSSLTQAA